MSASIANIQSETGWDAYADEFSMVARVMAGPATLEQLAQAAGERDLVAARRRVSRLVREGFVIRREELFEAPARRVDVFRQEGMLTSIARMVLPTVVKLANDPESGVAVQIDFTLDEEGQQALCAEAEKSLVDGLNELSEDRVEPKDPYALVVFATSDVPPPGPPAERVLETLRRCVRQRSTPELSSRAMVMRCDAHLGDRAKAEELVRRAAAARAANGRAGTPFTMFFGLCASRRIDGEAP